MPMARLRCRALSLSLLDLVNARPSDERFEFLMIQLDVESSVASRFNVKSASTATPRSQRANWWSINPAAMVAV